MMDLHVIYRYYLSVTSMGTNANNATGGSAATVGIPQFPSYVGSSNLHPLIGPGVSHPPIPSMPNFYMFLLFHRLFGLSQINGGNGQNI
jgi:hypothetical protein